MKVLISGAFGNIGSSALQELVRQGHVVRGFDLKSKKNVQRAQQLARTYSFEQVWGDIRNKEDVAAAVQDQDVIIHLAYMIPPAVDEHPEQAYAVNVEGTLNILAAAQNLSTRPKFLFGSSLDVFGHTQQQAPPRKIDDPVYATDAYTEHKLLGETEVKESGLEWAIFRFADVPPLEARNPHPIMFSIPLDTRFEMVHTHDVGLAIANGIKSEIWGKTWLIGGGTRCQVRYRDYLNRSMELAGIGKLPESAFGTKEYCTDWLASEASEQLLHYQLHSFDEIMNDLAKYVRPPAPVRLILPLIAPLIRRQLVKMSPYYNKKA
ncbi:MAG: NAD(P)-dependent oxidoreductase [Chloroflexota bacterium]|nr:NAD(P)-dependent oxidoreductase [Chloroflexota bacterium]